MPPQKQKSKATTASASTSRSPSLPSPAPAPSSVNVRKVVSGGPAPRRRPRGPSLQGGSKPVFGTLSKKQPSRQTSSVTPTRSGDSTLSRRSNSLVDLLPKINIEDLQFNKEKDYVGGGAGGMVFKAIWCGEDNLILKKGNVVAVKKLDIYANMSEEEPVHLQNLNHINVVKFYGMCQTEDTFLVTEFCEGGSLHEYLRKLATMKTALPYDKMCLWAFDLARGLEYLHIQRVAHRDVKSQNLLICKKFIDGEVRDVLKICDFGCSTADTFNGTARGTIRYLAPELIRDGSGGDLYKCDVYSMGVVFWEMLTMKKPFYSHEDIHVMMMVGQGESLIIPDCPIKFKRLVQSCIEHDPQLRPHAYEVVQKIRDILKESMEEGKTWVEQRNWEKEFDAKVARQNTEYELKEWRNYLLTMVAIAAAVVMLVLFLRFLQPDEGQNVAAHAAFKSFKGLDDKLNVDELKQALASLVNKHTLPADALNDTVRILESYDVHESVSGMAELDETEFTMAVATESTRYGLARQHLSQFLRSLTGYDLSFGNFLRYAKAVFGFTWLFFPGSGMMLMSLRNFAVAGGRQIFSRGGVAGTTRINISFENVVNTLLLLVGSTLFATAWLEEVSGPDVVEIVIGVLMIWLILTMIFSRWLQKVSLRHQLRKVAKGTRALDAATTSTTSSTTSSTTTATRSSTTLSTTTSSLSPLSTTSTTTQPSTITSTPPTSKTSKTSTSSNLQPSTSPTITATATPLVLTAPPPTATSPTATATRNEKRSGKSKKVKKN